MSPIILMTKRKEWNFWIATVEIELIHIEENKWEKSD